MKRILALTLVLLMCAASALAEIDLSGMTWDELVALERQVQMAMWASDEWQEVEVPIGAYEVGVDIPEGYWTISTDGIAMVRWGSSLDEYNVNIDFKDYINSSALDEETSVSWQLKSGTFIVVDFGSVIFTPYTGSSLGFK